MQIRPDNLPPAHLIENGPVKDAIAAWADARIAANEAVMTATQLEHERPLAEQEDAAALAAALSKGSKDPGPKNTRAHDEKIAEARRHVDARKLLLDQAHHAMLVALEEHQEAWTQTIDTRGKQAREQLADKLSEFATAHSELVQALALREFAKTGKWRPGGYLGTVFIPSLNREVGVGDLLEAMRVFTEEPQPKPDLQMVESPSDWPSSIAVSVA